MWREEPELLSLEDLVALEILLTDDTEAWSELMG
jgi:hypothetical protein